MSKKLAIISIILILTIIMTRSTVPHRRSFLGLEDSIGHSSPKSVYIIEASAKHTMGPQIPMDRSSEIPIIHREFVDIRPLGEIVDTYYVDGRLIIRGSDFLYVNGTTNIFWASETIVDVDYADIDEDLRSEYAVLAETKLFLLDDDLGIIWGSDLYKGCNCSRVLIANLTAPEPLIVLWKNNSSSVTYYGINGSFLGNVTVQDAGTPVRLLDMSYSGNYLIGLILDLGTKLVKWTYNNPNATKVLDPSCSPMANLGGYIYVIQHLPIFGCRLCKIYNGTSIMNVDIPDSVGWKDLIEQAQYFGAMDTDADYSLEFLIYNETHICVVDTSDNTSNITQTSISALSVDQGILYREGVATLIGNELRILDMTLTVRSSFDVPSGSFLVKNYGDILVVSSRGDCLRINRSDLSQRRLFINAGWNYSIDKNTLVLYNAHRASIYWVGKTFTYSTTDTIIYAVAMKDSALMIFNESAVFLDRNDNLIAINIDLRDAVMGDYGGGKISVVMRNHTLVTYDLASGVINRWTPPIGFRPVSIYRFANSWIYSLVRNTSSYAELRIYVDENLVENVSVTLDNPKHVNAMVVVDDKDLDDYFEIAYSLFVQNTTLYCNYTWSIVENGSHIWEIPPTLTRMPTSKIFTLFSSARGYLFINNNKVTLVDPSGISNEFDLGDAVAWGFESGVSTLNKALMFTSRGDIIVDIDKYRFGIGNYGLYSWTLYLNMSYALENLSAVLDLAPPRIDILLPKRGAILDKSYVTISWNITDDLGLISAELYVDDEFLGNISTKGEITLNNLSEGNHSVVIRAWDYARRESIKRTWFIVNLPLYLSVSAPNNTWINTETINISIQVYGHAYNVSIYRNCSLLLTDLQPNRSVTIYLERGINVIDIIAVGYMDDISERLILGYDPDPPIINLISPRNNTVFEIEDERARINITLSILDPSGISKIILIYGNLTAEITTQITLDVPVGDYYFIIGAYDVAGNYASILLHITVVQKSKTSTTSSQELLVFIGAMAIGGAVGAIIVKRRRRSY